MWFKVAVGNDEVLLEPTIAYDMLLILVGLVYKMCTHLILSLRQDNSLITHV